jgi:hypothetical protein
MDTFSLDVDFRSALALYIFLKAREEELSDAPSALFERLRAFLYERLSIEEMERPEELLARIGRTG